MVKYWALASVVGALLAVLSGTAGAGLFDVRLAVQGESPAERAEAAREGLGTVLQRLTGDPAVVEHAGVREALLRRPEHYVQQFGYLPREDGEGYWLRLRFDAVAVERRLTELEVAYWPQADRPRALVWLVVDDGGGRTLVGGDRGSPLQEAVREAGRSQGLTLLFPLWDLEDQRRINVSDVWGGFRAPILEASARYGLDMVLVVRLTERGGQWSARWLQFYDERTLEWANAGDSADEVLASGLEQGGRMLAEVLARVRGAHDVRMLRLAFHGVDGLEGFGFVMRLLRGARGVQAVDVVQAGDGALVLAVTVEREPERLFRLLEQNARLEPRQVNADELPVDWAWRLRR